MGRILLVSIMGIFLSYQASAAKPLCYLHGIMRSKTGKKAELADMIRLHFDANDKDKCRQMIGSYCRYNVRNEGYSPVDLEGYFKPDAEKSNKTTFTLAESCKVTASDDED